MPNAIQIISTLEYIGAYSTGTYFGLVLQVGTGEVPIATQSTQVTLSMASLLEPWNWKSPIANQAPIANPWWPQIQLWKYDNNGDPAAGDPKTATQSVDEPVPVDITRYDCSAIRDQLEVNCKTAIRNSNLSWIDPGKAIGNVVSAADSGYPWPAQLGQVTRLAYPIPHILRLNYLLKVNDPKFAQPVANSSYFATVTFATSVNGAIKTYTPQGKTQADIQKAPDGTARVTIPYDDPSLFLVTQPLTSFAPAATVIGTGTLTPEVKDWQAHLVAGCADIFDLPARLLTPVRSDCQDAGAAASCAALQKAVASEFKAYVSAFSTAQRNILSYGVLTGPDGSSLLSRLCKQWASQNGDRTFADIFLKAVQAQLQIDQSNADQSAVQDAWLQLLTQNPSLNTSSLIGPPPTVLGPYGAAIIYKNGQTVLYHGQTFKARNDGKLAIPSAASTDWTQVTPSLSVDVSNLSARLIAVEHLQQQFAQNDVLSALLLALWDSIKGMDATKYRSFRNSASAALATLNVRGLLLQGNLQGSWGRIVANSSRDGLRTNIPAELKQRVADLLKVTPGVSMTQALQDALALAAEAWVSKPATLNTLIPPALMTAGADPGKTTPPQRTRTTEGLSVLLGSMDAFTSAAQDAADSLRQMAGLCVLMREQTENIWRCLNVGNPVQQITPDDKPVAAVTGLAGPVVVPLPQHTQDGLRRATLTFNNQPLMSEGPAHQFGKGLVPRQSNSRTRLVSFRHPSADMKLESAGLQQWKIPGLGFSRKYDILIGRVSNSGALPAAFADPTLGPAVLNFNSVNAAALPPSIANIPYLRTVPVSGLRFGPAGTGFDKIPLPAIPTDVLPRARDTTTRSDQPTPLVMLASYKIPGTVDTFSLNISKPTTDLLTWDRWMAVQPGANIRALRSQVWERFNTLARQENSTLKVSLDDPAVRHLTITIDGVAGLAAADATDTKSWADPPTSIDTAPPPKAVISPAPALTLTIKVSETAPAKIFDKATWTLTVTPGTLATITLVPSIDANDQKLFASCIDASKLERYTFVVETANQYLFGTAQTTPTDSEILRNAIAISPPDGVSRKSVDFTLTLNSQSFVGSANIQTQVWRWDGRPSAPYPYNDTVMPPTRLLLEWELEVFSSRIASDATFRPMTRSNQAGPGVAFEAHDDRSADPGATFYRAGVTAYSRYGSMIPVAARSVSTLTDFASVPGADGGWVRSFIRAILPITYVPPKPAIKFIVPLTGSEDQSQPRAASALVIVQGPWYALGGLAEELRAHIADASQSIDFNTTFQEAGADPILFSGQRKDLPTSYQDYDATMSRLHGPVGHTFDQSDANPLWVYSSFVLDPPLVKTPKADNAHEGTFAAVQFTRVIRPEGVVNTPKGGLVSLPTDRVWVQFLPSRFSPFTAPVEGLHLEIGDDGKAGIMQGATPIKLSHSLNSNSKTEHLVFALLLTEEVPDLLGRKGQERFRDVLLQPAHPSSNVLSIDPDTGYTYACWSGAPQKGSNYIGRVLAIQRQVNTWAYKTVVNPPLSSAQDLWVEMFPNDDAADASSRIVAVSPPISVSVPVSCSKDTGGQK
jgi:hypothetical protein